MYTEFGIKKDLLELAKEVENEIKPQFCIHIYSPF